MFGLLEILLLLLSTLTITDARSIPTSKIDTFLRNLPASNRTLNVTSILEGFAGFGEDDLDGVQLAWPRAGVEAASDEIWCKAISKGTTLLNSMLLSDENAGKLYSPPRPNAQSLWDHTMLNTWGWQLYNNPNHMGDYCQFGNTGFWGIDNYLRKLEISDKCRKDGGEWDPIAVYHRDLTTDKPVEEQEYTSPSGQKRKPTGANHYYGINGKDGGILAYKRYGVEKRGAEHNVPKDQWPPFRQSSDLMWSLWEMLLTQQGDDLANIQFFMSLAIINTQTQQILRRAFDQRSADLQNNIMFSFGTDTEEGKALLGAPNVFGFGYFLINHKKELGGKFIDQIIAIEADTRAKLPILMATVENYDKPMDPEDLISSSMSASSTASTAAKVARAAATGQAA